MYWDILIFAVVLIPARKKLGYHNVTITCNLYFACHFCTFVHSGWLLGANSPRQQLQSIHPILYVVLTPGNSQQHNEGQRSQHAPELIASASRIWCSFNRTLCFLLYFVVQDSVYIFICSGKKFGNFSELLTNCPMIFSNQIKIEDFAIWGKWKYVYNTLNSSIFIMS